MYQVYNARMCFVLEAKFWIEDETAEDGRIPIEAPTKIQKPGDVPFPVVASFIFHATQEAYMKANFYPRLLKPSMTTTNTNQVDQTAVQAAAKATEATDEEE